MTLSERAYEVEHVDVGEDGKLYKFDPKKRLQDEVASYLPMVHCNGIDILVAVYVRRGEVKLKGNSGLLLPKGLIAKEDIHQGVVGLIVAVGPLALDGLSVDLTRFGKRRPKFGDWIMYRLGDTVPFLLGPSKMRLMPITDIRLILDAPDIAL